MPISNAQIAAGAARQLESYAKNDPVDQVNTDRPLLKWLIANKVPSIFGNGIFNEKVRISNDSNYQNYTGDDQVTYNRKDTVRKAPFQHYEAHDGFGLNETELANNGIVLTDDREAVPTEAEKIQIVNLIKENRETLKLGFQENLDIELHMDGTASSKACPGIDLLVSTSPSTGTIGGIDAATAPYWRNNANLGIQTGTAGTLIDEWEQTWRACTQFGGQAPNGIFVGSKMLDAFRKDARLVQDLNVSVPSAGGVTIDPATKELRFHGVLVQWDPTLDAIQAATSESTNPWDKRAYFLQSATLKLRPFKGRWMINRTPPRMYDRYTHYFGLTADYGLTCSKRNDKAVLSIK